VVTSQALYFGFLILLSAERCVELAISRANARVAFENGAFEVGQRHYRFMALLHTLFFLSCAAEVHFLERPFAGNIGYVALVCALLGQALRYSAVSALGRRWNVRIIVWPLAEPVATGPYRFVRHPNYLAVGIELAAIPLVHGAFLTALVFSIGNVIVLSVRIREEERALGERYAETFRDRPRFIPRFFGG